METPRRFLGFVAKALINAVSGGLVGTFVMDVLPGIARDVWNGWNKEKSDPEKANEIQGLAQAPPEEIRIAVKEVISDTAAGQSKEVQASVATFLTLIPGTVRQSLRRPEDPRGLTVPPGLSLHKAEDLLPFLPQRLPRFRPGALPIPGVDLQLVQLLGVGGFGEVWKARNPKFDGMAPVALKFCLDPAAKERLLHHEAAIVNAVMRQGSQVRGIVQLRQTYLDLETPCLEYEYIAGGDLSGLVYQLHKDRKPSIETINRLVLRLVRILGQVHRLKPPIIHRDLKPANVLVQRQEDQKVTLRVTDFGIGAVASDQALEQARAAGSHNPFANTVLRGAYTPLYASPQQVRGEAPDPRDDVHALGVIWYQMLIGDLSKPAPVGGGWRRKLQEQGASTEMLDLLQECFEEDPAHRLADAAVLTERLDKLVNPPPKPLPTDPPDDLKPDSPPQPPERSAAEWFAEGNRWLDEKAFASAVKSFNAALKGRHDEAEVCRQRAKAYRGRGDEKRALKDLNQVIALGGKDVAGFLDRGDFYLDTGENDRAAADFARVLQLDAKRARAFIGRGRAYKAKAAYDLALSDFNEALRLDPQNADVCIYRGDVWVWKRDLDRAVAEYSEAVRLRPECAAYRHARGVALGHQERFDEAVAEFSEALRLDARFAPAYHDRGRVFLRRGQYDLALSDLNQTLLLESKNAAAYHDRAKTQARLDRVGPALADYGRAIKAEPRNAALWLERGCLYLRKGDHDKATADFTKAMRLNKNCADAYAGRAEAYFQKGWYGSAISDYTKLIELRPDAGAHLKRGSVHLFKDQFDQALADAEEALCRDPASPEALSLKAHAHLGRGEHEPAVSAFSAAIERRATAEDFNYRGTAHQHLADHDRALADFTEAIRLDGKYALAFLNRARSYRARGEEERAEADRSRAIKLNSDLAKVKL